MLHTVNKSPFSSSALDTCVQFSSKDEPILLYEDAVYAAQEGTKYAEKITAVLKSNSVYALEADLDARGIKKIIPGVKIVNYDGFVDLVEKNKVQNWL
jgi:tRNA 2-thiouridine synthesizing protein B